jgi:hypothetical protein
MAEEQKLLNVGEAQSYVLEKYGVIVGRDWVYAQGRRKTVPVVWIGKRRLLFPRSSLDALMAGQVSQ